MTSWNIRQVARYCNVRSRTTVYNLVHRNRLPPPIETKNRSPMWDAEQVRKHLAEDENETLLNTNIADTAK